MQNIENEILKNTEEWEFDEKVSSVFDCHVVKSIPFYNEIQTTIANLSTSILKPNSTVIDLGTATGETIFQINKRNINKEISYLGLDNSLPMLKKARVKCSQIENCAFQLSDIIAYELPKADLILSVFTMQFLQPNKRYILFEKIRNSINENGYFIICEKIEIQNSLKDLFIMEHERWKLNHFNFTQIENKKERLRNVMFPVSMESTLQTLNSLGFTSSPFFQWYNFIGIIAKWEI